MKSKVKNLIHQFCNKSRMTKSINKNEVLIRTKARQEKKK